MEPQHDPNASRVSPSCINGLHDRNPSAEGPSEASRCVPGSPPGYELFEEIVKGEMGIVYRARDLRLGLEVAVKLPSEQAKDHSTAAAGLHTEAKITAQLQHPGIPAVHELGTLADGRPFLAMKLVKGRTLQALLEERSAPRVPESEPNDSDPLGCDGQGATSAGERGRLIAIFEQVCQTLGYAHAHGVIHRGLNPSNVMVGAFGEVQVLDWSMAKVLSQSPEQEGEAPQPPAATVDCITHVQTPDVAGVATRTSCIIGAPAYMAPEQAAVEMHKLNAQTDVFALGAMLCEILIGRPPYHGKDANEVRVQAVRGELAEVWAALDACGAEPQLVALCKRCLAFRQQDRPADAAAVAEELARIRQAAEQRAPRAQLVRGEPDVRAAKQVKRRRVWLAWAASSMVVLVATSALIWANKARRVAVLTRQRERELAVAGLQTIFGSALCQQGDVARAVDMLEKAVATRTALLGADHPDTLTSRNNLAGAYQAAAEFDKAIRLFEQTLKAREAKLGPDHPDTLISRNNLALAYQDAGQLNRAIPLLARALQAFESTLGPDHPHTLSCRNNLALAYQDAGQLEKALPLLEQTLKAREAKLGPNHPDTIESRSSLAGAYQAAGEFHKAIRLFEQTLKAREAKLGPDDPDTLSSRNNLALAYRHADQVDRAITLLEQTLQAFECKLGPDHPHTLSCRNNLASAYRAAGDLEKALPLFEQTLQAREAKLGANHPNTLTSRNNLALAYQDAGQLNKALPLFEQTLEAREAKLGPNHPDTLTSRNNLALAYQDAGELDKALPLFEQTLQAREAKLGPNHPDTLTSRNNLALAYQDAGQLNKALPLFEQTLEAREAKLGPNHPDTIESRSSLGLAYQATGQLEKALPLLEETLKAREAKLGPNHPDTLTSRNNLAVAYQDAGELDKALPLFEQTLQAREAKLGPNHPDTLTSRNNLASAYRAAGELDKALALFEQTLQAREAKLGPNHPDTLTSRNNLASAYRAAGELDKALPLFEQTLQAREAKLGHNHPDTLTSRNNLARAYQAAGKLDKALPLFEQAASGIATLRFQHKYALGIIANTINAYEEAGQFAQAEVWRRKWLAVVGEQAGTDSPAYAEELAALGSNLLQQQKWPDAQSVLAESLALRQVQEPHAWKTFNTRSMLGAALLGQEKYAEAEPLLLDGYKGMQQRAHEIPVSNRSDCLAQARKWLIELYDAWGKTEEAARWRQTPDDESEPPMTP